MRDPPNKQLTIDNIFYSYKGQVLVKTAVDQGKSFAFWVLVLLQRSWQTHRAQ